MEHAVQAPVWAEALEASGLGLFMRQSAWAYPAANLVHLLGLVLLVGPILLFDLRALGFGSAQVSAATASRLLTPFAFIGAVLAILTGPLLFLADARALATNTLLIVKLALVAAALVNAALFRVLWSPRLGDWDAVPPVAGRLQALVSIALWLTAASLGRMIAYL